MTARRFLEIVDIAAGITFGLVLVGVPAWALLMRILAVLFVVAMMGCGANEKQIAALDAEVAALTSIALHVHSLPQKDGTTRYFDRTPEQKAKIAEAGETLKKDIREACR